MTIRRGDAPLIVSIPHAGTDMPADVETALVSPWIGRQDADWHVDRLYDFARELGATIVATSISRTVVDVNRDPSGASLYPGQATTELCPTTTFDGEPLWREAPVEVEIARRVDAYFRPYHAALDSEIARLRALHPAIVLYEAHSIRSVVPRLFDGELPQFNIGTNSGKSCAPELAEAVRSACSGEGRSVARPSPEHGVVIDGRFKGGWTTRHYGRPEDGVHAIQMELAMRGYLDEPTAFTPETWPVRYDDARAAPMRDTLAQVLRACIAFAKEQA
nr:N-formylglutamate deformylase [Sphingomonas horti]